MLCEVKADAAKTDYRGPRLTLYLGFVVTDRVPNLNLHLPVSWVRLFLGTPWRIQ